MLPALEPLETVTEMEVLAVEPEESVARAVRVCGALESEVVLRLKDQLVVPEAVEKLPLSTCTATELRATASEAVPETVMVPETVAPLAGEEIATTGAEPAGLTVSVAALLVRLPAELLITTVNCDPLSEAVVAGVV